MNQRRRSTVRAPQEDGKYVVTPQDSLDALIFGNRQLVGQVNAPSIIQLSQDEVARRRRQARRDAIDGAVKYCQSYLGETDFLGNLNFDTDTPLILSGHQPEFFHPGVWFKNFLLAKLAKASNGLSINLTIDNDVCSSRGIVVPTGTLTNPRRETIHFDAFESTFPTSDTNSNPSQAVNSDTNPLPYELATWRNRASALDFPDSVKACLGTLMNQTIILDDFWKLIGQISSGNSLIGQTVAQSRHLYEQQFGLHNLEVPLSRICQQETFFHFLNDILHHAESFQSLYNRTVGDYRKKNRIRSQSHPVPELVMIDNWFELPFWVWSSDSPWRGALHVKREGNSFLLSDRDQIHLSISADNCLEELGKLATQNISIRPRALMTTLFVRLFIADLFIHGIGGAKYDELTDRLMLEFYGIHPPRFLTATSTHRLPFGVDTFDESLIANNRQEIRSRLFNPEKHIQANCEPAVIDWVNEKRELLERIPEKGHRKSWDKKVRSVNSNLVHSMQSEIDLLREQRQKLFRERKRSSVLNSREYSFLLHTPDLILTLNRISTEAAAKFI